MKEKPNILLITVDSLRADAAGGIHTPYLAQLSKSSYVYTRAIAPGIPTFFCFPSIFTGRLPFTFGHTLGIPDHAITFPMVLAEHGYSTSAFIGDNPNLYTFYGYDKGFMHYVDGFTTGTGQFLNWSKFFWNARSRIPDVILDGMQNVSAIGKAARPPKSSFSGMELNAKVRQFFARKKRKPFFCWIHYMDVHLPYATGISNYFFRNAPPWQRLWQRYRFFTELPISIRKLKARSPAALALLRAAYESCVRSIDDIMCDLIPWIKEQYPNTVIIITSDHGEEFMEHGHFQHEPYSLYDELIRVPLFINLPTDHHNQIDQTVSLVSLAKTICKVASLKTDLFLGSNLLDMQQRSSLDAVTRTLYSCRSPQVRHGILDTSTEIVGYRELWSYSGPRYKYIVDDHQEKRELYDLELDPGELVNKIRHVKRANIDEISALHNVMDRYNKKRSNEDN